MSHFKKPMRHIARVFIHCSATDKPEHDNIETIRNWHVQDNKWADIGYHFFINKAGKIFEGRNIERTPAAQAGHNTSTIAICLSGLEDFTQSQFDALNGLCDEIQAALPHVTFHGHKEVAAKECPVFDYRRVLNLDKQGRRNTGQKPLRKSRTIANASTAGVVGTALAVAPAVEPAGRVVEIAQDNPQGLLIVIGLALIAFAAIAIYLKIDDRRKGA